jgi:NAD(P)-dependent dehydrogenase (short-subunit alcohol dehydrogenase family)
MNIILSEDRAIGILGGRPDHETATFHEDHRRSSIAGTKPSYSIQDLGSFGITVNCIALGVIATGRIMATVIPGSIQSNRDRAESVALRRLGTVEDYAKVIESLATDLSDYVTGALAG